MVDKMLELYFASTEMSVAVLITACTEQHASRTVHRKETNIHMLTVLIIPWKSFRDKKE